MRILLIVLLLSTITAGAQPRKDLLLNTNWRTTLVDSNHWQTVDIPHNWADQGGDSLHGDLHGSALYTRTVEVKKQDDKRYFLWFEGVGSYATVRVNDQPVGTHAGGLTSFTLDITKALKGGTAQNTIEVRADHPANIHDLPWVGGDSAGVPDASQPFGIFRSVHLLTTSEIRIQPFGVHIWNDTTVNDHKATLFVETELKNYTGLPEAIVLTQQLYDTSGAVVATIQQPLTLTNTDTIRQQLPTVNEPHLWSPGSPYRYTLVTEVARKGKLIDRTVIGCGIRRIRWADSTAPGAHPFTINGKAVIINGVTESERRIGNNHAFTLEEIRARVEQIRAAGFNAVRDAHGPHNLYYQHFWDSIGMFWWPEYSNHAWVDSPAFRNNFKQSLLEWVKERRNSPSIILWGLQDESKLPADFAKECADLIRKLDPTASSQRLIVTSNGGEGADRDIPQNWTATDSGDVRFVNYNTLFTGWGEPLDTYYRYKAGLTPAETDPMVYIVSHNWPDRWETTGVKSGIVVYSNCDTIELFNGPTSLGKRIRHGGKTLFQWDSVEIKYATLEAVAHYKGQQVATDEVQLTALRGLVKFPVNAPRHGVFGKLQSLGKKIRSAVPDLLTRDNEVVDQAGGYNYLYRLNCGGETYTDHDKNVWLADTRSTAGQRTISDSIENTVDNPLLQSFRYGLQNLSYTFPVTPGEYRVELYFVEPWLGTGSPRTDCTGWRQFDVAVNDQTVIKDLDIWKEAEGRAKALRKVVTVRVTGNTLVVRFPKISAGQALISAIAVATKDKTLKPVPPAH